MGFFTVRRSVPLNLSIHGPPRSAGFVNQRFYLPCGTTLPRNYKPLTNGTFFATF
jgi:hypothetical protein